MTVLSPFTTNAMRETQKWIDGLDHSVSFVASDPQETYRKCWAEAGLCLNANSFQDALWTLGLRPRQIASISTPGETRPTPQFKLTISGGSDHGGKDT